MLRNGTQPVLVLSPPSPSHSPSSSAAHAVEGRPSRRRATRLTGTSRPGLASSSEHSGSDCCTVPSCYLLYQGQLRCIDMRRRF
eukprot:2146621-Pleurochrysis_carterae.AAC.3